jgi:DNA-binding response OmpR family regulator
MARIKGHILLIEPDDLIRRLVERWLREEGYRVSALACHKAAQLPADGAVPRLVVADVPNPQRARVLIESLQHAYRAPVLALSARFRRGLGGSVEAAHRLGVRNVLPKPFTREELLGAVAEAMSA